MFHTAALYCLILYLFFTYNTEMFCEVRNIYVNDSFLTLFMHMVMHEILKSILDQGQNWGGNNISFVSCFMWLLTSQW